MSWVSILSVQDHISTLKTQTKLITIKYELALESLALTISVCVSIEEASVKGSFLVAFVAVLEGCIRLIHQVTLFYRVLKRDIER